MEIFSQLITERLSRVPRRDYRVLDFKFRTGQILYNIATVRRRFFY